jgi:Zn ribbon nucleic-acid-binding protein
MKAYAYCVEGAGVVCPECRDNYLDTTAIIEEEEAIGYPDGYTCADCGTTIKGENKWH